AQARDGPQPLDAQDELGRIDAAAAADDAEECSLMTRFITRRAIGQRFQRLDDLRDDRDAGGAHFLAAIARHAAEDRHLLDEVLRALPRVARVERRLAELHERRGAAESGELAQADDRARRVA